LDAKCPGLDAAWIREAKWKAKELSNYEQFASEDDEGGWNIPMDDSHRKEWVESDSKVMVSYLRSHRGWPSVEGGIEVLVEVRLDLRDSEGGHSACRLPMSIGCLSVLDLLSLLCHSTIGTSSGSCTLSRSH
jgi:hypothetical protein